MKALERYSGDVVEITEPQEDMTYFYIDEPESVERDSFFKRHPNAFNTIATVSNLDISQWYRSDHIDEYDENDLMLFRHIGIQLTAFVNKAGMITDFETQGIIFMYSAAERQIYCPAGRSYNVLNSEVISDNYKQNLLKIMYEIYGKEDTK